MQRYIKLPGKPGRKKDDCVIPICVYGEQMSLNLMAVCQISACSKLREEAPLNLTLWYFKVETK